MDKDNIFNVLFYEFKEWLVGIFEEDPLPLEINTIYFFYGKVNNSVYISLVGTELDKNEFSDFTYNPLEAQFFYSKNFFNNFQNKPVLNIKQFITVSKKKST